jgi:hypothetical protein
MQQRVMSAPQRLEMQARQPPGAVAVDGDDGGTLGVERHVRCLETFERKV